MASNGSDSHGNGGDGAPHFVKDIIVIRREDGVDDERLGELARSVDGELIEEGDLVDGINLSQAAFNRLNRLAGFIRVGAPEVAMGQLRDQDPTLDVGRIAGLQFSFHYISGETKPTTAGPRPDLKIQDVSPKRVVAIVDTGVADKDLLPKWMQKSIVAPPSDREPNPNEVSHGTFVASLIRQVADTHGVSVAKADVPYQGERSVFEDRPRRPLTTEAHVSDAILRLIERHGRDEVEALNISLGGTFEGEAMTLLRAAIEEWREAHPNAPIFAAAGNSEVNEPVYPAAHPYPDVIGVAAANRRGEEIVWEDRTDDLQPAEVVWDAPGKGSRSWVNALAPGSQLWGAAGTGRDDFICWSGSSFASALAAAGHVAERQSTTDSAGRRIWAEADLRQAVSEDCCDQPEAAD